MQENLPISLFESETLYQIPELYESIALDLMNIELVVLIPANSLNDETRIQIEKIFLSCNIVSSAIYITDKLLNWSMLQQQDTIKNVVLFGVNPKELGIFYHIFPYRFFPISGKFLLLADELNKILTNAALKSDFWFKCLKPHFNIS